METIYKDSYLRKVNSRFSSNLEDSRVNSLDAARLLEWALWKMEGNSHSCGSTIWVAIVRQLGVGSTMVHTLLPLGIGWYLWVQTSVCLSVKWAQWFKAPYQNGFEDWVCKTHLGLWVVHRMSFLCVEGFLFTLSFCFLSDFSPLSFHVTSLPRILSPFKWASWFPWLFWPLLLILLLLSSLLWLSYLWHCTSSIVCLHTLLTTSAFLLLTSYY